MLVPLTSRLGPFSLASLVASCGSLVVLFYLFSVQLWHGGAREYAATWRGQEQEDDVHDNVESWDTKENGPLVQDLSELSLRLSQASARPSWPVVMPQTCTVAVTHTFMAFAFSMLRTV